MRLYYALGGGMGHLTRALAFVYTMNYKWNEFVVVISGPLLKDIFPPDTIVLFPENENPTTIGLQQFLLNTIEKYNISEVYLDAFPAGIIGEWDNFPSNGILFYYIARNLNWENYKVNLGKHSPFFKRTYIVEQIEGDLLVYINKNSENIEHLHLTYPKYIVSSAILDLIHSSKKPVWLIVHSGPLDEVESLYHYVLDLVNMDESKPLILLCTQTDNIKIESNTVLINYFFIWNIFSLVDKIITACGFNLMHQTIPYKEKHIFIPFSRKYDDQFLRAKNRKFFNYP